MTPVLANVLQPLIDAAHWILRVFHDELGFSWGASIIGMTVVVRILIIPLTYKGIRGMQNMQRFAPEMKKLQERYKDDKQRQQQEMMRFYQEHQINPFSSCLPFLLQIPFFISLFYLLRGDEFQRDIRGEESFLFIPNLAEPATGDPGVLITLIVLYIVTQLGASLVTAISADRNQRMIMLGLPFVFVAFIVNFETGLLVYWITTNVWTVGQQLFVKKFLPAPEPLSLDDKDREKPARGAAAEGTEGAPDGRGPRRRRRAAQAAGSAGNGAAAKTAAGADGGNGRAKAPPPPPRKKKKRSGRRR